MTNITGIIGDVIAGPIVRKLTAKECVIWVALKKPAALSVQLPSTAQRENIASTQIDTVQVGAHAFISLITLSFEQPLVDGETLYYDIQVDDEMLSKQQPWLCYADQDVFSIQYQFHVGSLLHGSCRNPHYPSRDTLLNADELIAKKVAQATPRPAMLLMTGDQIYADDVAGPMLLLIRKVIDELGLYSETFIHAPFEDTKGLYDHPDQLYLRDNILPKNEIQLTNTWMRWIKPNSQPVFSSVKSHNHLISLAENIAMYLLVWSPVLWTFWDEIACPESLSPALQKKFELEYEILSEFKSGLNQVQRLLAHIPTYMIFDDHDVTDDWNLTAQWEMNVYGNPFSKRIIGNSLIAYWLFQGWGNAPERFTTEFYETVQSYFSHPTPEQHDVLVNVMLGFERWHYKIDTFPKIIVLDTRTHRWRSEEEFDRPSGLMDWETLSELQQDLMDQEAVIMVSAAPVFGVKLIEAIQEVFAFFGKELLVDVENWMAHPGAAKTLLQIIKHPKTPKHFTILSGDVHYSFVYDAVIRFAKNSPQIWQITCSGIKNQFPLKLIACLDKFNRILYSPYSFFNWFTKRKRMRIRHWRIEQRKGIELLSQSAIGHVTFDENGCPDEIAILTNEQDKYTFHPKKEPID